MWIDVYGDGMKKAFGPSMSGWIGSLPEEMANITYDCRCNFHEDCDGSIDRWNDCDCPCHSKALREKACDHAAEMAIDKMREERG